MNPAIQLVSYSIIFGYLHAGSADFATRFLPSLMAGLWPWWTFQDGVMRGLYALVEQADLLRRVPIRPEICVAASVTGSVVIQTVGFCLFLFSFSVFGLIRPSSEWVALCVWAPLGLILTVGVALVVAPLFTILRDVLFLVNTVLTIGFFASPVLYEVEVLPHTLRYLALLNPVASLITLYRNSILNSGAGWNVFAVSALCAGSLVSWSLAVVVFSRVRTHLDEFL